MAAEERDDCCMELAGLVQKSGIVSPEQKAKAEALLGQYQDIFAKTGRFQGRTNVV